MKNQDFLKTAIRYFSLIRFLCLYVNAFAQTAPLKEGLLKLVNAADSNTSKNPIEKPYRDRCRVKIYNQLL